jgi:hypothetical protein
VALECPALERRACGQIFCPVFFLAVPAARLHPGFICPAATRSVSQARERKRGRLVRWEPSEVAWLCDSTRFLDTERLVVLSASLSCPPLAPRYLNLDGQIRPDPATPAPQLVVVVVANFRKIPFARGGGGLCAACALPTIHSRPGADPTQDRQRTPAVCGGPASDSAPRSRLCVCRPSSTSVCAPHTNSNTILPLVYDAALVGAPACLATTPEDALQLACSTPHCCCRRECVWRSDNIHTGTLLRTPEPAREPQPWFDSRRVATTIRTWASNSRRTRSRSGENTAKQVGVLGRQWKAGRQSG